MLAGFLCLFDVDRHATHPWNFRLGADLAAWLLDTVPALIGFYTLRRREERNILHWLIKDILPVRVTVMLRERSRLRPYDSHAWWVATRSWRTPCTKGYKSHENSSHFLPKIIQTCVMNWAFSFGSKISSSDTLALDRCRSETYPKPGTATCTGINCGAQPMYSYMTLYDDKIHYNFFYLQVVSTDLRLRGPTQKGRKEKKEKKKRC